MYVRVRVCERAWVGACACAYVCVRVRVSACVYVRVCMCVCGVYVCASE